MLTASRYRLLILLALVFPLSGCLFRSHKVEQRVSSAPLKSATQQELTAWLNSEAAAINTMNATVDIAADVGGAKRGKVTQYQEIRGYILVRKPEMLRMIGLMPIVRNRAFDMVSDGRDFKLWIPPKNKFYVGSNTEVPAESSGSPIEKLRPKVIYDALLLNQVGTEDQIGVLDNGTEIVTDSKSKKKIEQPDYELLIIQRDRVGWYLSRKFIFNRTTLHPDRQIIYDKKGNIATDIKYGEFRDYGGIQFPSAIEIKRPEEEYTITLGIVKATINQPVTDEQFALAQPAGSQLIRLDASQHSEVVTPGNANR